MMLGDTQRPCDGELSGELSSPLLGGRQLQDVLNYIRCCLLVFVHCQAVFRGCSSELFAPILVYPCHPQGACWFNLMFLERAPN